MSLVRQNSVLCNNGLTLLDCPKLEAYADDKINVTENMKFVLERVENIMGKGENAGFQKALFFRVIKSRDCVV